jgi:hypothetical protein
VVQAVVNVVPEVVAGLDKGGEDLYLAFTCEVGSDVPPTNFRCKLDLTKGDGYSVRAHANGEVRYHTDFYELEWCGTDETAFELVKDKLADKKNWAFCHKPGEEPRLRFYHRHYVDGNAD